MARISMVKKAVAIMMVLALLVAVAIGAAGCSNSGDVKINWLSDWTEALNKAQDENKPIMIYFYTELCPACRHLEENAFSDGALSAYLNDNIICLESNADRSTLHNRYEIKGTVPTTVFSKPDGYEKQYEIARLIGSAPAEDFYQAAQAALEQVQG
ncbi:MAG TPA: DUF255 domain-containing protein [Dehalococcoidia bacterium]|nr:DUF255 domain-containing protein [Dehalococcoidia bacterium]